MDIDQELLKIGKLYTSQGYETYIRPESPQLPSFAQDFQVELLAKRGNGGVLVQVKRNREEFAADANTPRYVEITNAQPGWTFDFILLEPENPQARELQGAQEPSVEQLQQFLTSAEDLVGKGYSSPAVLAAWAGFEAAMRRRLRAAGEKAERGAAPGQLLNELYSAGLLSADEFPRLQQASRLRNEIVHGFASAAIEPGFVPFLTATARRLVAESPSERQPT